MAKKFFVIVHENCIDIDLRSHAENQDSGLTRKEDYPPVCEELARIKREELFVTLQGDPSQTPYLLPPEIDGVKVCGAYGDICVEAHKKAIARTWPHLPVEIHPQGTIFFTL